nr:phosphatidylinositol N-acetylglucosaminyltransferase subunit Q-like [Procambarus clarkii]XP_045584905.1 phosphatidylinositol N-acetylglucosaminyltransferase subunit Q-like [Procambarus clarkii]
MLGYATVTVLVPIQLQGRQSGYLCGNYTSTPCCTNGERASHVVVVTFADLQRSSCVGCINNKKRSQTRGSRKNLWVELQTKPYLMLRSVRIQEKNVSRSELNLVLYDAQEVCESEIVCKKFLFEKDKDHTNDIVPYFVHCVQEAYQERAASKLKDSCIRLIRLMIKLFLILLWIPKFILENLHSVLVMRFDYSSSALQQLLLRISQLEKLHQELQVKKRTLLSGRLLTMIMVDILIGIAGASIISNYASVNDIYTYFCSWTKMLASIVHRLLEWLSGVPAGLKLNQPLTQALSAFFSYHVHLWRLYLELADPLLRGLAWVLVWLGMCGASVQVAILSDLFDLATLHLYCFYVYGARIHMLQISLLGSQWRAFRGRKWNPLKQRVDSYDIGGHVSLTRVLTAVVFTLVIFLLPTTTIYYMVFVLLRVGLNLMRGMMAFTIWLLNINPLYLFLLNITNSNRIKGDIFFSTVAGEEVGKECKEAVTAPLVVQLHTWPTALSEVLLHAHAQVFPHRPSPNWKFIFSSIMFGEDLL